METSRPLSGKWLDLFKNPGKLSQQALKETVEIFNSAIKDYDINGVVLPIARFEKTRWENVTAEQANFGDLTIKDSAIINTSFFESKFGKVIFENVIFEDVSFVAATFGDAKFINCTISATEIRNLDPSKIEFVNTEAAGMPLFQSSIELIIKNSNISDSNFVGLKQGSSILIENSFLNDVDIDMSYLTTFTVTDSKIKKTKVQDTHIGKVIIANSTLGISFARSVIDEVHVSETQNEFLGFVDASINSASISFCKGRGDVNLSGLKFNSLNVRNCNDLVLSVWQASGKEIAVTNCTLNEAIFYKIVVGRLLIDNVEFNGETDFDNAQAKQSEVRNIKKGPSATITAEGSNIRLY